MRMMLVAICAVTLGVFPACAEEKKPTSSSATGNDRAARFAELKAQAEKEQAEMFQKFQAASPADRAKIRTEAKELYILNATRALRLAEENPKDDTALEAAIFAIKELLVFRETGEDFTKALGIIRQHHLGNPKVRSVLTAMGQAGEPGQLFLQEVADKATDKETKAVALYILGSSLAEQIDDASDPKQAEALTAKAISYLEDALAVGANVFIGNQGTLADAAKEELEVLKTLSVGKPAPDVQGTDVHTGKKMKLSDLKGKVVLLDIWATWCGPCKAMIPHEREMVKRLEGKPFQLLSVSADDEKETLTRFLEKTSMPWLHWWDGPESEVLKKYRVRAFPTLYLIDSQGIIRRKFVGVPPNEVLDKAVEGLVEQAAK